MTRVAGGGLASRNPFGVQANGGQRSVERLHTQVERELFSRRMPAVVEDDDFAAVMGLLTSWKNRLARLAKEPEESFRVRLCDGTMAMIDASGLIVFGRSFLRAHAGNVPLLVGVLAHEIGHRPRRWQHNKDTAASAAEVQRICRSEETQADWFAGAALAEFGLSAEPMCELLLSLGDGSGSHQYFPANVRVDVVREAHEAHARKSRVRKEFFPSLDKHAARYQIGSG
jgi:hypothetical protein